MQKSREKLNQEEAIKRIKFVIKEFNYSIIPPFKYKGDRNTDVTLFCQKHNYRWNISFHSLNKLYNKQLSCYKGCKYCRKLYTKEKCAEVALKCKTRSEFASEYKGFYFAALRNKWLDEICSHMTVVGNRYFRCIYSYEINFSNIKYVYVGLTENLEARDLIHSKRGSVYDFCKKNSLEKPKIKKLTEYLPKEEASKLEGFYLLKYIEKGWIPINKVHTGGLGGHLKFDGYTYDECLKIGQTYKTRSEWKQKDYSSYYIASKFNWIDTIKPPKKTYGNKNIKYWTKEQCILEAKKYKSLNEFRKNSNVAYVIASKNKWIHEIETYLIREKKRNGFTLDIILKKLDEYENITSFYKENPSMKEWCYKHKIQLSKISNKKHVYSTSNSKKVFQYDLDGNLIRIYKNAREASEYGFNYKKISLVCNGKNKTHKGFIFRFEKK